MSLIFESNPDKDRKRRGPVVGLSDAALRLLIITIEIA